LTWRTAKTTAPALAMSPTTIKMVGMFAATSLPALLLLGLFSADPLCLSGVAARDPGSEGWGLAVGTD
jgi:hypothetical protein